MQTTTKSHQLGWIQRHQLASFFLLAYLITWSLDGLAFIDRTIGTVGVVAGTFGPAIAAVIVLRATGDLGELRTRLFTWRISARWYLIALGLPTLGLGIAYSLYLLIGGTPVDPSTLWPMSMLPLLFVYVLLLGGGNEEPGWRGFALPRLLNRYSALQASVILGIFWAFWHAPLFFLPGSIQANLPILSFLGTTVVLSVLLTWLFNNTGESVLIAILFHTSFNTGAAWVASGVPVGSVPLLYTVNGLVLVIFMLGILAIYGPARLSRTAPDRDQPVTARPGV